MDRKERRRARGVDGDGRTLEIEEIRNAIRADAGRVAGAREVIDLICRRELQRSVVGRADADEDTRLAAFELRRRNARVLERFPHGLEQQALLRIHAVGFVRRDAEERGVERVDLVEETTALRIQLAGAAGLGIEVIRAPPARRDVANAVDAVAQQPPELVGATRARHAASDADDGNGFVGVDLLRTRGDLFSIGRM